MDESRDQNVEEPRREPAEGTAVEAEAVVSGAAAEEPASGGAAADEAGAGATGGEGAVEASGSERAPDAGSAGTEGAAVPRGEAEVGSAGGADGDAGRTAEAESAVGRAQGPTEAEAAEEVPAAASPEKLAWVREVVEGLVARLGVEAEVEVVDGLRVISCRLRIRSGGELFGAGPRGQVLEAARYLVNKMVNREPEGRKAVELEVRGSAEEAADPAIGAMALRLGEAAKRMGKTLTVVPMPARDRKSVHQALAGVEGVRTRSEGDGLFRRLLVEPEG